MLSGADSFPLPNWEARKDKDNVGADVDGDNGDISSDGETDGVNDDSGDTLRASEGENMDNNVDDNDDDNVNDNDDDNVNDNINDGEDMRCAVNADLGGVIGDDETGGSRDGDCNHDSQFSQLSFDGALEVINETQHEDAVTIEEEVLSIVGTEGTQFEGDALSASQVDRMESDANLELIKAAADSERLVIIVAFV